MSLILSGTDGLSDVDGSAATPAIRGTDANTGIFFPAADTIAFSEGGAEIARFDSSGNLGIGVTSPATKLDVSGVASTNQAARFLAKFADTSAVAQGNGGGIMFRGVYTGTTLVDASGIQAYKANATDNNYSYGLAFTTRANGGDLTANMRLDENGNMGLGVTPSAWGSGFKALQIGARSAFFDSSTTTLLGNNTYYDGSNYKYIATAGASLYDTTAGLHRWYNAASGTAGNAISFTQAMTLDANGRLFVNTTTEPGSNDSAVVIKAGGTSKSRCLSLEAVTTGSVIVKTFRNPNGQVGYIATDGSSTSYVTSSDYRLKESIQPMTGALAKVALLKPVTYKWKVDGSDGQGFIAHELQEVVPDAVSGAKDATEIQKYEISPAVPATFDEEGNELTSAVEAVMGEREVPSYQGIDTSFLVATLTAAIQEQQAIITQLQADVAALQAPQGTP